MLTKLKEVLALDRLSPYVLRDYKMSIQKSTHMKWWTCNWDTVTEDSGPLKTGENSSGTNGNVSLASGNGKQKLENKIL